MKKKNFKDINPAMAFISTEQDVQHTSDAHLTQDVQDTYEVQSTQIALEEQHTQRTQKTKGQKLPRINMAFSFENLEYLQLISRIEGISITEYVNKIITLDKDSRAEEIEKAKSILKK